MADSNSAASPFCGRRLSAPTLIAMPQSALVQPDHLRLPSACASPQGGSFGLVPIRPKSVRFQSDQSRETRSSGGDNASRVPTPWIGAATSPGVQVDPAAVDYFNATSAERHSWRAMQNLGLVAVGRSLLTLGLGGVLEGFSLMAINAQAPLRPVPGAPPTAPGRRSVEIAHPVIFGLGMAGAAVGLSMHVAGLARFYSDTSKIKRRRAQIVLAAGTAGAVLVTVGGSYYLYGIVAKRDTILWEALPLRSVGNFLVYGAIPNSFSASEMVHGDIPLKNRVLLRDLFFALGGMFLMTWAQISTPDPPAPLWAREIAQCLGIICIAMGGALPRVDGMRAQAQLRAGQNSQ
jgi:hypothetical protein